MTTPLNVISPLPEAVVAGFAGLSEPASLALAHQIQTEPIATPLHPEPIVTAYATQGQGKVPVVLLPGFDSSLLEFRRLFPLLSKTQETWAIDLLGFGFTARPLDLVYSPASVQTHLHACWQQLLGQRPLILVGASMGGTAALDFTLRYPQAVAKLVLLDSAGIKNGPTLAKYLVSPLDTWAVEFLRRPGVRRNISRMAYGNPDRWVTPDAECCAALHVHMPHWQEALRSFTRSGGYRSLRSRLSEIQQPTLIVWGRNDRILGTQDGMIFAQALPQAQLVWIEECGHVPHLEQPEATAAAITRFI